MPPLLLSTAMPSLAPSSTASWRSSSLRSSPDSTPACHSASTSELTGRRKDIRPPRCAGAAPTSHRHAMSQGLLHELAEAQPTASWHACPDQRPDCVRVSIPYNQGLTVAGEHCQPMAFERHNHEQAVLCQNRPEVQCAGREARSLAWYAQSLTIRTALYSGTFDEGMAAMNRHQAVHMRGLPPPPSLSAAPMRLPQCQHARTRAPGCPCSVAPTRTSVAVCAQLMMLHVLGTWLSAAPQYVTLLEC